MTKIILKKGREESLLRFHPWVFSGAIAQIAGQPAEGDIVGVFSHDGSFLAYGHYQIGSIAVRILSFAGEQPIVSDWYMEKGTAFPDLLSTGMTEFASCRLIRWECFGLRGLFVRLSRLFSGIG